MAWKAWLNGLFRATHKHVDPDTGKDGTPHEHFYRVRIGVSDALGGEEIQKLRRSLGTFLEDLEEVSNIEEGVITDYMGFANAIYRQFPMAESVAVDECSLINSIVLTKEEMGTNEDQS